MKKLNFKKIKISVATFGYMPAGFDKKKIETWKSKIFSINGTIQNYAFPGDSDGENWTFTDKKLDDLSQQEFDGDFLIAIVNVPLEGNWYTRRLSKNRIFFTFHEIKEILNSSNIPLENVIYRILYVYTLLYLRNDRSIPLGSAPTNFTHDDTRECLFDMNGYKKEIIYSCHRPIICSDCAEKSRKESVSTEVLELVQKEINEIKKPWFFRAKDYVQKHPVFSVIAAIILGIIGSYIATVIYEYFRI